MLRATGCPATEEHPPHRVLGSMALLSLKAWQTRQTLKKNPCARRLPEPAVTFAKQGGGCLQACHSNTGGTAQCRKPPLFPTRDYSDNFRKVTGVPASSCPQSHICTRTCGWCLQSKSFAHHLRTQLRGIPLTPLRPHL